MFSIHLILVKKILATVIILELTNVFKFFLFLKIEYDTRKFTILTHLTQSTKLNSLLNIFMFR